MNSVSKVFNYSCNLPPQRIPPKGLANSSAAGIVRRTNKAGKSQSPIAQGHAQTKKLHPATAPKGTSTPGYLNNLGKFQLKFSPVPNFFLTGNY